MSSSFVSLAPLVDTEAGAFCHLLEIDSTRILINCGLSRRLDVSAYDAVMAQILSCDAILLTSFNISCTGALPYILRNSCYSKIYSSAPVKILGRICLEEHLRAVDGDVADSECMERVTEIKYSQPAMVDGVEICAFNAGNSIGACLYRISKGVERIVVGFGVNHRKENHIDGMGLGNVMFPTLCVVSSSHVLAESISAAKRDEVFRKTVEEALERGRTVVLPVRYSRLLEIALVVNEMMGKRRQRAMCLSYLGQRFVERARSMVEWAGEKVSEMFSEEKVNPFDFEHIEFVRYFSRMPADGVVIVVDEGMGGSGLWSVLKRYGNGSNVLLLTDPRMEEEMREMAPGMRHYDFRMFERIVEEKEVWKENVEAEEESVEAEEGAGHWSESRFEVWCEGGECFPSMSRRRVYDDYGEYVDRLLFAKEIVPVEEAEEIEASEESMVEEKELVGTGVALEYRIAIVDFMGVSDLNSCKTILESMSPRKLVCVGEDADTRRFFYHTFKYMTYFEEVYTCVGRIVLSSDVSMGKVRLSSEFGGLGYQRIGDALVGKFLAVRDGETVRYVGDTEKTMLGYVDMNEIKRSLVESNLRVEQDEEGLVVEDCVWIRTTGDGILIDGDGTNVFYAVRNAVYKNIAFV